MDQGDGDDNQEDEDQPNPFGSGGGFNFPRGDGGDDPDDPDDPDGNGGGGNGDGDGDDARRFNLFGFRGKMAASQLSTLPTFDGSDPSKLEEFIFIMQSAQRTWGWSDDQLASAVKTRLTGEASSWLFAETKEMKTYPYWMDPDSSKSLKVGLMGRFGETVTQFAAMSAVRNLTQKAKESVDAFYDRVKVAVDKRNHTYSPRYKASRAYQRQFREDVLQYFSTGLKDKIRSKVLLSPATPTSAEEWRQVARRVEAELKSLGEANSLHQENGGGNGKANGTGALKISELQTDPTETPNNEKATTDDLQEVVNATIMALQSKGRWPPRSSRGRGNFNRPRGNTRGNGGRNNGNNGTRRSPPTADSECYECRGKGHFASECPSRVWKRNGPRGNRQFEVSASMESPLDTGSPSNQMQDQASSDNTAEVSPIAMENWW